MSKANFFTVLVYERGEPNRTGVLENKVLVDELKVKLLESA